VTSKVIIRGLALAAVAAVSFGVTLAARQQSNNPAPAVSVPDQLSLAREQWEVIQNHDMSFEADLATLRAEARTRRQDLCAALESNEISDSDIRAKAAALRAAENRVQERVLDHLLAIRQHLTPDQQRRLLNMCAQGMRQGGGGGGMRWGPQDGSGPRRGGGGGAGGGGPYRGGGRGGPPE
jgi:Spy/CpxP family protein refolding chaperone